MSLLQVLQEFPKPVGICYLRTDQSEAFETLNVLLVFLGVFFFFLMTWTVELKSHFGS